MAVELDTTWLVPQVPLHIHFRSEHIAETDRSYSCRIIGHIGTHFTEQMALTSIVSLLQLPW